MFKKLILTALALVTILSATAHAEYVRGYTKKNGTYVNGYNRSDSDGTVRNNYSYVGNTNPYTQAVGTNYYRNSPSSQYYQPQPSYTLPQTDLFANSAIPVTRSSNDLTDAMLSGDSDALTNAMLYGD